MAIVRWGLAVVAYIVFAALGGATGLWLLHTMTGLGPDDVGPFDLFANFFFGTIGASLAGILVVAPPHRRFAAYFLTWLMPAWLVTTNAWRYHIRGFPHEPQQMVVGAVVGGFAVMLVVSIVHLVIGERGDEMSDGWDRPVRHDARRLVYEDNVARPVQVTIFECAFIASLLLGMLQTAMKWQELSAKTSAPMLIAIDATIVTTILFLVLSISRWRSRLARSVLVRMTALGIPVVVKLAMDERLGGIALVNLSMSALQLIALGMLFTPSVTSWMRARPR